VSEPRSVSRWTRVTKSLERRAERAASRSSPDRRARPSSSP
jgi:hypothetical protein